MLSNALTWPARRGHVLLRCAHVVILAWSSLACEACRASASWPIGLHCQGEEERPCQHHRPALQSLQGVYPASRATRQINIERRRSITWVSIYIPGGSLEIGVVAPPSDEVATSSIACTGAALLFLRTHGAKHPVWWHRTARRGYADADPRKGHANAETGAGGGREGGGEAVLVMHVDSTRCRTRCVDGGEGADAVAGAGS